MPEHDRFGRKLVETRGDHTWKGSCRFRCPVAAWVPTCYIFFSVQLIDGWFFRVVVIFTLIYVSICTDLAFSFLSCGYHMLLLARKALAPMAGRECCLERTWGFFFWWHYMFALYTCTCLLEKSVRFSGCWVLCIEPFDNHMGYHHNLVHVHFDWSDAIILLSVPRDI